VHHNTAGGDYENHLGNTIPSIDEMGHENYLTSTGHVSLFSAWEHLHKPGLLPPSTLTFIRFLDFLEDRPGLKKTATWYVDWGCEQRPTTTVKISCHGKQNLHVDS